MTIDNRSYYRARAQQEVAAASQAADSSSAAIHLELANLYQARADEPTEDSGSN